MAKTMKIVTYNMLHNKMSTRNWSLILDKYDPEIVLAQESLAPEAYRRPLLDEATWQGHAVSTRMSVDTSSSMQKIRGTSSSDTSRDRSTTGSARGTANPPSSLHGMAMTRWTLSKGAGGWYSTATN